jgi:hypothetical protein
MVKLSVQDVSVFEDWLKLEKACLDELSTEPLEETLKMEYYQELVNLDEAEYFFSFYFGTMPRPYSSTERVYQLCVAQLLMKIPASRTTNRTCLPLAGSRLSGGMRWNSATRSCSPCKIWRFGWICAIDGHQGVQSGRKPLC